MVCLLSAVVLGDRIYSRSQSHCIVTKEILIRTQIVSCCTFRGSLNIRVRLKATEEQFGRHSQPSFGFGTKFFRCDLLRRHFYYVSVCQENKDSPSFCTLTFYYQTDWQKCWWLFKISFFMCRLFIKSSLDQTFQNHKYFFF